MENKKNIYTKKVRSNLVSIFLINTVVLFTLSLISFIYLNSSSVENYFKENIIISIYLKNNTKEVDNKQLIKFLNLNDDVKETSYLSKADAAEIFSNEIGEEFLGFLGYNPLLDALSVRLKGDKIDTYSIENFIKNLNNFEFIEEIEYDKPLVDALNKNFDKIGMWILILSILFFTSSFILINNSIKISIYSKRDIIKTMQLVGATSKFIRRPFIWTYIKISFLASITSLTVLFISIFQLNIQIDEFNFFTKFSDVVLLISFILLYGISSSYLSSYFVTQKYLKLKFVR
ncbi:MAG: FtsX-like permease family protein [Flavobacteriales bacterium]|nr:MAG: FtsX-like permease family protein [Flavobacteriales bacterium]CAI8304731.1 MAG: Cell division protein FtsX [Flavobacteriales bacterium]